MHAVVHTRASARDDREGGRGAFDGAAARVRAGTVYPADYLGPFRAEIDAIAARGDSVLDMTLDKFTRTTLHVCLALRRVRVLRCPS